MSHRVLSGLQFEHHRAKDLSHELTAKHPVHGEVGWMKWYGNVGGPNGEPPGQISMVQTHDPHKGKGVATQLWNHAQDFDPPPVHSPDRTSQGDAWARSVGGPGL